jgi:hypothetical protein
MKANYKELFNTANGLAVLADLERIVQMTRLDSDNPNPNSAVWKCAQQALLQRIYNQIDNPNGKAAQ